MGVFKDAWNAKKKAEEGLQNYGANIRKNVEQGQADLRSKKISSSAYINPFPNPLKKSSYQKP